MFCGYLLVCSVVYNDWKCIDFSVVVVVGLGVEEGY
jgi:hypothetical protein